MPAELMIYRKQKTIIMFFTISHAKEWPWVDARIAKENITFLGDVHK
jgi:hypothetical protein